ncbi:MAG: L,D-transpeptidase family protein [Deltaproteobacteria bacterium]
MKRNILIGAAAATLAVVFVIGGIAAKRGRALKPPRREASSQPARAASGNFDTLLKEAEVSAKKGELLDAQRTLKDMRTRFAADPRVEDVQKRLEDVNMRILVSGMMVPGLTVQHEVVPGDTLSMIADTYRTTVPFIMKQNGLTSDVIRRGQILRVWTGRLGVVVDKSQNVLLLNSDGELIKTYQVSTGRDNITPVGTFKIVTKLKNPAWTHEGRVIPYGDPRNILGTRWMGFDLAGYGIHGTAEPEKIGQQVTAGCVRMRNGEVEELYDLLPVNTEVTIMD